MSIEPKHEILEKPETYIDELKKLTESECFPVDAFPLPLQKVIYDTNRCLNFPIEFIGGSLLAASSIMIGKTQRAEVMPGWIEKAVLYLILVGRPGVMKSPPLKFAMKPIMDLDRESYKSYVKNCQQYEEGAITKKPVFNKHLVSDATQEAVVKVHEANPYGIGVYVDEISGWLGSFDRYTQSKGGDEGFYLTNWSDGSVNKDRTNSEFYIPNSFISVVGTIQPGLLNDILGGARSSNGFMDRILSIIPKNLTVKAWSLERLDQSTIKYWQTTINKLKNLRESIIAELDNQDEENKQDSITLKFSNEAFELIRGWQMKHAKVCNEVKDDVKRGLYSKMDIYCIRLSLIFEVLHSVCQDGKDVPDTPKCINILAVKSAISLISYFKAQADDLYKRVSDSSGLENLSSDKKEFYQALSDRDSKGNFKAITTKSALLTSEKWKMSESTVKRFLGDKKLFKNIGHGKYEKLL